MLNYRCLGDYFFALAVKLRLSIRLSITFVISLALLLALGLPAIGISDYIPSEDAHANTTSIGWQMLPGESLNDLAALFYPHQRTMQQRFVAAALRLNRSLVSSGATKFEDATDVLIPDLKSLSYSMPKTPHVASGAARERKPARHRASRVETPASPPAGQSTTNNTPAPATTATPSQVTPDTPAAASHTPGPDMQAQYDRLVRLNLGFKLQLEQLNQRINRLQAMAEHLFAQLQAMVVTRVSVPPVHSPVATTPVAPAPVPPASRQTYSEQPASKPADSTQTSSAQAGSEQPAVSVPRMKEPQQFKQLGSGKASIDEPPPPIDDRVSVAQAASARDAWIKWVAPFILTLVAVGGVALIIRWRMHPMSNMTMLEDSNMQPVFTISGQRRKTKPPPKETEVVDFGVTVQPEQTPLKRQPPHAHVEDVEQFVQAVQEQPTAELLGTARQLLTAGQPVAALLLLQNYLGAYPRQSVLPWLHALEIHHSLDHRKAFSLLAEQMHQTFSEETEAWSDTDSGMTIESKAADRSEILLELDDIWHNEKAVFGTPVLKEVVVLQEVLKARGPYSQGNGMGQLS